MMMILRSMNYEDVLRIVKGKNTVIWTCGTCAKICNGIGGQDAADRLAERLRKDGTNVSASVSVSAACLMSKVIRKETDIPKDTDLIISLTCDIGVECASKAFGKDVLAPLTTIGCGFVDTDGSLMVVSEKGHYDTLKNAAAERGMGTDPLV